MFHKKYFLVNFYEFVAIFYWKNNLTKCTLAVKKFTWFNLPRNIRNTFCRQQSRRIPLWHNTINSPPQTTKALQPKLFSLGRAERSFMELWRCFSISPFLYQTRLSYSAESDTFAWYMTMKSNDLLRSRAVKAWSRKHFLWCYFISSARPTVSSHSTHKEALVLLFYSMETKWR